MTLDVNRAGEYGRASALKPESTFTYRPDIDGLRAVAVLSVVLFHANLGVPGGFVGVDVFFVISGFLITHLVVRDLRGGTFRLGDFWQRRARRILPALLPAVIGALLLSIAFLPPAPLAIAASSAAWLGGFASNIFFWKKLDYFSTAAESTPLLHTWSLAVEEQFYLLFPPLLMLGAKIVKRSINRLVLLVAALATMSLVASLWLTKSQPMLAFYFLPTRAFELLTGALLVFLPKSLLDHSGRIREVLSMAGLLLIGGACFFYTKETPFPGWHALVPCLGTALFILSNTSTAAAVPTWSGKALAWRPFVFVGLVSYSFYLWHWPPLALANHWHFASNSPASRAALVLGAFVCAVLSWRFVEKPFRKPGASKRGVIVAICSALALGALIAAGSAIAANDGKISRVPPQALAWLGAYMDPKYAYPVMPSRVKSDTLPTVGVDDPEVDPTILIWGDSHAMAVMSVIDEVCRESGQRALGAWYASTLPVRGYYSWGRYGLNEKAIPFAEDLFVMIQEKKIRKVILIAYWTSYFEQPPETYVQHGISKDPFVQALMQTVKDLQAIGVRVYFQRQAPNYAVRVPEELARQSLFGQIPTTGPITMQSLIIDSEPMRLLERELAAAGVVMIDTVAAISTPAGVPMVALDGKSLYGDNHHLSTHGAALVKSTYRAVLEQ